MARPPRVISSHHPHHVMHRGNNRGTIFVGQSDYEIYLEALHATVARSDCQLHASVLMTNPIHLLLSPTAVRGLPSLMQALGKRYVRYVNDRYHRSGALGEGRYRSTCIDAEASLLACHRSMELNPVRVHMVQHPGAYAWSSDGHHGEGIPNTRIQDHPLYEARGPNRHTMSPW